MHDSLASKQKHLLDKTLNSEWCCFFLVSCHCTEQSKSSLTETLNMAGKNTSNCKYLQPFHFCISTKRKDPLFGAPRFLCYSVILKNWRNVYKDHRVGEEAVGREREKRKILELEELAYEEHFKIERKETGTAVGLCATLGKDGWKEAFEKVLLCRDQRNPTWPSPPETFKSTLLFFWRYFHWVEVGLRQEQDLVLFVKDSCKPFRCVCVRVCAYQAFENH